MGKKTKNEKEKIEYYLSLQMSLIGEIARRNPKIHALMSRRHWKEALKDGDPGFSMDEYEKLFKEIYGDVFPRHPFPVWRLNELEDKPYWLVLKIDLNYTKDEIMYRLNKFVSYATEEYRQKHIVKVKRKHVEKWVDYLEIWDLKNGFPPPKDRGMASRLEAISFQLDEDKGREWTYEEIAKYVYPDTTTPEKLESAIDKVKKQYRAAYSLICGEKYNSRKAKKQIAQLRQQDKNGVITCDSCPDKPRCITPCPSILEEVAIVEVKRQEQLAKTSKFTDLEKLETSSKKLPSDDQFK